MDEQTNDRTDPAEAETEGPDGAELPQLESILTGTDPRGGDAYVLEFSKSLTAAQGAAAYMAVYGVIGALTDDLAVCLRPHAPTVGFMLGDVDRDCAVLKTLQKHFKPTIPDSGIALLRASHNTYDVFILVRGWILGGPLYDGLKERLTGVKGYTGAKFVQTLLVATFIGEAVDPIRTLEELGKAINIRLTFQPL